MAEARSEAFGEMATVKYVAEAPSEQGQGAVRASMEMEMPSVLAWSLNDKFPGCEHVVEIEGGRISIHVKGYNKYAAAAQFIHTVRTGEAPPQAAPPRETNEPTEPSATALDLEGLRPKRFGELLALLRDAAANAKIEVQTGVDVTGKRTLDLHGEFAGGQVVDFHAVEPPVEVPTPPIPTPGPIPPIPTPGPIPPIPIPGGGAPEPPSGTALEGWGGEEVAENAELPSGRGLVWRCRATAAEDPDSLEAENENRLVQVTVALVNVSANNVNINFGVNVVGAVFFNTQAANV